MRVDGEAESRVELNSSSDVISLTVDMAAGIVVKPLELARSLCRQTRCSQAKVSRECGGRGEGG